MLRCLSFSTYIYVIAESIIFSLSYFEEWFQPVSSYTRSENLLAVILIQKRISSSHILSAIIFLT